jgi:hypothetical protein
LNSSHACPGSFISAYKTNFPSSLLAYKTRQNPKHLRCESHVCLFCPLEKPTPPKFVDKPANSPEPIAIIPSCVST